MKLLKTTVIGICLLLLAQPAAATDISDRDEALDLFKTYVNNMVQKVEKAEEPAEKRRILNQYFDNMISVFDRVRNMGLVSGKDKAALATLRKNIREKKDELNGLNGYRRVSGDQLNHFANYVQQDLEQADTVTISISVTLLALILILLLLL